MGIITRMINGLVATTATLVLVNFVYNLVIRFKNKVRTFRLNTSNIIAFLIAMIVNLFVIYGLIWIISFFSIRV